MLAEAVAMLGELPELPTRDSFELLMPENSSLDDDDEVMLDPNQPDQIERPHLGKCNVENSISDG